MKVTTRKRFAVNAVWVFLNTFMLVVGLLLSNSEELYLILSLFGLIQLLTVLILYRIMGEKLFGAITVYTVVMFLFLYGQCLMWLFSSNYSGRNIIDHYTKSQIVETQAFTLFSIFFFHLACLNTARKNIREKCNRNIYKALIVTGCILLVISIIPEIIFNIRLFTISYNSGYMGVYDNKATGLLLKFLNLREFFFPAVVLIVVGDSQEKKRRKLIWILIAILIFDMLTGLYVGSRGDALMQFLSLMLLKTSLSETKTNIKNIIILAIIVSIVIVAINVVRVVRSQSNKSMDTYISAIQASSKENIIIDTMGEMGGSMSTCIETMNLVPEKYPFKYGLSYILSFTWFLPEPLNGINEASMNKWIDSVRYTGSGWGFSTTAEAYFNFGKMGVLLFLLFGAFAGRHFRGIDNQLLSENPLEFSLCFILLARLLVFSRIDFLSTLPTIIYFYVLLKLFIIYIQKKITTKGNDE